MKNHITFIPDLRYKITKEAEEEIAKRAERRGGELVGFSQRRVGQIEKKRK